MTPIKLSVYSPSFISLRIVKRGFLLSLVWFILHTLLITLDGLIDSKENAEVALVLGNTVQENGEMSERLKSRVDKGLELYKAGQVKTIVVSGGLGKEGHYEAEVMKHYLLTHQVPATRILVDNYGNTTYMTALNYEQIRKKHGFQSVIVVS
jgi:vancomycin permeability regulator SanA